MEPGRVAVEPIRRGMICPDCGTQVPFQGFHHPCPRKQDKLAPIRVTDLGDRTFLLPKGADPAAIVLPPVDSQPIPKRTEHASPGGSREISRSGRLAQKGDQATDRSQKGGLSAHLRNIGWGEFRRLGAKEVPGVLPCIILADGEPIALVVSPETRRPDG